jgi:glycine cleavage system H protein
MLTPKNLKYTKDHEWIQVDGKIGTVGITDFAQKQLGDIVFVELHEVGKKFDAGTPLGTIESVKAVAEIYNPVTGQVTEVNPEINDAPEDINAHPYTTWLYKLELSDPKELNGLLNADQYDALVAEEEGH